MESPVFIVGNEDAFLSYVKKLNKAKKIAVVSHTDMDGIASARVVQEALGVENLYFVDYIDLNSSLIEKLRKEGASHVIFTDLMIKEKKFIEEVENFAEVLIIDHHTFENDFTSKKTVFLNAQGFCASYLSYYLFSKVKNLEKIDWIVACACLTDWCYFNNKGWMSETYAKYGETFNDSMEGIKQSKIWDISLEISYALIYFKDNIKEAYNSVGSEFGDTGKLKKYASEIDKEVKNCLKKFEEEKIEINDGYFWEFISKFQIKSIVNTILSKKYLDKTILIAEKRGKYYMLSARRQDKKFSMNDLLKKLTKGFEGSDAGGHVPAAGGHIFLEDAPELKKRIKEMK